MVLVSKNEKCITICNGGSKLIIDSNHKLFERFSKMTHDEIKIEYLRLRKGGEFEK